MCPTSSGVLKWVAKTGTIGHQCEDFAPLLEVFAPYSASVQDQSVQEWRAALARAENFPNQWRAQHAFHPDDLSAFGLDNNNRRFPADR